MVGCGQMGGALLDRWLGAGIAADRVLVIDPAPRAPALPGAIRWVSSAADLGGDEEGPDLLVLGVKPQSVVSVATGLVPALAARVAHPLVVSMLAGVRLATIAHLFSDCRVARIMPNLGVRVGKGATVLHAPAIDVTDRAVLEALMAPTGLVVPLDDEARFDAVTAVSGSGPGFVYRFVEALAGAGEAAGLDAATATALARQSLIGAAALLEHSGQPAATLRQQVTSPNGTTEAGLDVLDGEGALSALMRATIRAAAERSRALAAAADAAADPPPVRPAAAA
jgi:pyrroline-5-carboxylate reductase